MGSIQETKYGTFRAFWRDDAGKGHNKTLKTRKAAENHLKVTEGEIIKGDWFDPKRGQVSFQQWIEQCREASFHLDSGTVLIEETACNHILPALGHIALRNLDDEIISKFINTKLKEGLSPSTVARQFRIMRKWLNRAVEKDRIRKNPCSGIQAPEGDGVEMRFLTMKQLVALAEAMPERYYAWTLMMGILGPRYSEANGLRRKSVKIVERRVGITEQLVYQGGQFVRKPKLKTAKSRRSLTMSSPLVEILGEHLTKFSGAGPDGLVFPNGNGEPLIPSSFTSNTFKRALKKADLDVKTRIHDLRHTAVALAINEKAQPLVIQRRMGHSSIKVTFDLYGHLFDEIDEKLSDALGTSLTGALGHHEVTDLAAYRSAS